MATLLYAWDVGGFVVACDVEARDGRGRVTFSVVEADARRFADVGEALDYWKRPSTVRPLRPDGKPNRPLSAYSVELRQVDRP
jgi:hypothetical protein